VASREALQASGGFDESLGRCEDFDMWLRLSLSTGRIGYHSDAEVFHREHDASLSANGLAMYADRVRVYEKIASLPVSGQQRRIINTMVRKTHGECYLAQLKEALTREDYAEALQTAELAYEVEGNWKLKLAKVGLRVAPRLFVSLDRVRSRLLKNLVQTKQAQLEQMWPTEKDAPSANA
jgi:hypothetical protein